VTGPPQNGTAPSRSNAGAVPTVLPLGGAARPPDVPLWRMQAIGLARLYGSRASTGGAGRPFYDNIRAARPRQAHPAAAAGPIRTDRELRPGCAQSSARRGGGATTLGGVGSRMQGRLAGR